MANYKPYCISTPPYEITSGGIRVMHALRSWLEIKGQIALTNTKFDVDFNCIYPEIIKGNPSGSKNVIRYLLNKPGKMALMGSPGPTKFSPNDKIYVFSEIFNTVGADEDHIMFLPILNLFLFKNLNKQRTKTCYFIGKGFNQLKHPKDSIEINRGFASDQAKLAETLNECEVMYCYDDVTAMTEIARLCGCRVIIYPQEVDKYDWEKYEPGMNGITWGDESEEKLNTIAFRKHYQNMIKVFEKKLDKFIYDTQN